MAIFPSFLDGFTRSVPIKKEKNYKNDIGREIAENLAKKQRRMSWYWVLQALSRALGDYCLKEFGVISVPGVTIRNITSRDKLVILAIDGVCIFLMMVPTLSFPLFWLGPSNFLLSTQWLAFFPLLFTTHYNFHSYCEKVF